MHLVYSTLRPCFDCTKASLQAKVKAVYYLHNWEHPITELREQYEMLQKEFSDGVRQVSVDDPDADWANAVSKPS